MLAEHRQNVILSLLAQRKSVSITALGKELGVSRETIRRDIMVLAGRNRLRKIHGGAISIDPVEADVAQRRLVNAEGKRAIGEAAAALVPDGVSLILDSGTTTHYIAQALTARLELTVYTNDLDICSTLGRRNGNRVFLLGGQLLDHENGTLGLDTTRMLSNYVADFAFVGAGAVSSDPWLMDFSRDAAELRALMLASAGTAVVVADHTKFDRVAPIRVDNFDKATHLVTDVPPSPKMKAALESLPAKLVVAGETGPYTKGR